MFGLAFINGQNWIFGPVVFTGSITINGDATVTGNLLVTGWIRSQNSFHASNGSAANPSYAFYNSQTTGFFRAAADNIGVSIAGVELARFTATGLGIGTTTPGTALHVVGDVFMGRSGGSQWNFQSPSSDMRVVGSTAGAHFCLVPNAGSVLIGTTVTGNNGALQLANHSTSTGGIGFGTDIALYRSAPGRLAIDNLGATDAILFWANSGTVRGFGEADGSTSNFKIGSLSAGWSTIVASGNGVTALTLDSSQRCILSGALRLNNAYTAGAVVSTGYVTIQDSTGTTYKVAVSL